MEQNIIRLLKAEEIECRVGMINENGLSLLLYMEARAGMRILDEAYNPLGWQRRHEIVGGNLYCTISVWDDAKKQWISKMDVGTESHTEKEKGQASDSFKRACVSFGIGRELYSAPFIWISAGKVRIENRNNKLVTTDKFKVTDISYGTSREITALTIANQDGKEVYCLKEKGSAAQGSGKSDRTSAAPKKQPNAVPDREQEINRELVRTGVTLDTVLKRYNVSSIQEMDSATYKKAMGSLRKTKAQVA